MFPNMFADSMLETSWAQHTRRSWTTLTSFGLQAVVIGLLLLIPLLNTVGLPTVRKTVSTPISMGRPEPALSPQPHTGNSSSVAVNPTTPVFIFRGHIPTTIPRGGDVDAPSDPIACLHCMPGYVGPGSVGGGENLPFSGIRPAPMPAQPAPPTKVFRTSNIMEGSLIRKVEPPYPPLAKSARIQGPVVLFAVISRSGTIDNLRVLSGHPMLVQAAIDAVKQWRYRPYILNQEPIEVETQITINFVLGN
jgi:periplasmic protein TonB